MKKGLFTLVLFVSATAFSVAQDVLVLEDGNRLEVILEIITDDEIRYRRFENPAGPLFTKSRKSVTRIEYENGTVEQYGTSKAVLEITQRNLVGYNYFDLVTLNFSMAYERLLGEDQNVSLYVPVRVGFAQGASYVEDPNVFGIGAGFMVYPFGQRKISYYTGPLVTYSIRDTYVYMYYYDEATESWINESYNENHNFFGAYVVNGMKLNFNDRLGLNFNLGLGFLMDMDYEQPENYYDYWSYETRFHGNGEISLFYRF